MMEALVAMTVLEVLIFLFVLKMLKLKMDMIDEQAKSDNPSLPPSGRPSLQASQHSH